MRLGRNTARVSRRRGLAGLALLVPLMLAVGSPDDPRGRLRARTRAYWEQLQRARTVRFDAHIRIFRAEARYYRSFAAYCQDPNTLTGNLLSSTSTANLFVRRTVQLESIDHWTRELQDGELEQKWTVAETAQEPGYSPTEGRWVTKTRTYPFVFRASPAEDGELKIRVADENRVWITKHFSLLGHFTTMLVLPGDS